MNKVKTKMNVSEAAKSKRVSEKTITKWCDKGLIRGVEIDVKTGGYIIPVSFKRPYPYTANVKGIAIYKNIVKAVMADCDVVGKMYNISDDLFEKYCLELVSIGVIEKYIESSTGIEYFKPTLKSSSFSMLRNNQITKILDHICPDIKVNVGINFL